MVRGAKWARARGRHREKVLLGLLLLLLHFARLIMLLPRGARGALGHLPLHSSREPSRRGLATPGPRCARTCDRRRVQSGAQRKEYLRSLRVDRGTSGPSAPALVCHGNRSQPGRGQVLMASRLLTALPARRPLKRKREGETARVKKESALLGRAAGANHRGRCVGPRPSALSGSSAILRLPGATPAHLAPAGLDSKLEESRPSPHTPQLSLSSENSTE